MSQDKMHQAKSLIEAKRYTEARNILIQIDHPTAKKWLDEVNRIIKDELNRSASMSTNTNLEIPSKPENAYEIIVTTGDLKYPYDVVSPVYFQVSNKGLFSSALGKLKKKYSDEISAMKKSGQMSKKQSDWGILWYGEVSMGQNDFEVAFFVATREIQNRAFLLQADAIIGMRQDIDLDTDGFQFFYLQMYGTAVRFRR